MSKQELTKEKVEFEVSPYYYMVKSGKRIWYWIKETGEFDGTSFNVGKAN